MDQKTKDTLNKILTGDLPAPTPLAQNLLERIQKLDSMRQDSWKKHQDIKNTLLKLENDMAELNGAINAFAALIAEEIPQQTGDQP